MLVFVASTRAFAVTIAAFRKGDHRVEWSCVLTLSNAGEPIIVDAITILLFAHHVSVFAALFRGALWDVEFAQFLSPRRCSGDNNQVGASAG